MGRLAEEIREASLFITVDNPTFFDIGANDGDYTREALERYPLSTVFAFEPDSDREIFKFNDSRVSSHNFAISNDETPKKLYKPSGLHSQNAFHSRPHFVEYSLTVFDCDCKTIDSFVAARGISSIDFMKIDTEGHEIEVLLGAKESLRNRVIKAGSFEYGGTWVEVGKKFSDALNLLKSLDYRVFTVEGEKKLEMDASFSDDWKYFNFYFSHANVE